MLGKLYPNTSPDPPLFLKKVREVHFDAWLVLAVRNLCLTEEKGREVMTRCSGCTNTLRETDHILAQGEILARLAKRRIRSLEGLKAGTHYRCHYFRPTCFSQFYTGQLLLSRREPGLGLLPAFHIAELVAYALGAEAVGLNLICHKFPAAVLGAATPDAG